MDYIFALNGPRGILDTCSGGNKLLIIELVLFISLVVGLFLWGAYGDSKHGEANGKDWWTSSLRVWLKMLVYPAFKHELKRAMSLMAGVIHHHH